VTRHFRQPEPPPFANGDRVEWTRAGLAVPALVLACEPDAYGWDVLVVNERDDAPTQPFWLGHDRLTLIRKSDI